VQFTGYFTPIVKVDKKKVVSIFEW
jgi:hypothetical protein